MMQISQLSFVSISQLILWSITHWLLHLVPVTMQIWKWWCVRLILLKTGILISSVCRIVVLVSSSITSTFSRFASLEDIIDERSLIRTNLRNGGIQFRRVHTYVLVIHFIVPFIHECLLSMSNLVIHILYSVSWIRRSFRNFIYIHFLSVRLDIDLGFLNLSHNLILYIFTWSWVQRH